MREFCYAVAASFFGSLGFAVLFNTRGKRILISAVGGAVFWGLYLVFIHFVDNQYLGFFFIGHSYHNLRRGMGEDFKDTGDNRADADRNSFHPGRGALLCGECGSENGSACLC